MSEFQKVLVVDDGARNGEHALSAQLAELGFASVTTSLEATDEVLDMIAAPTAILIQLPVRSHATNYKQFIDLAERLKAKKNMSGIPIMLVGIALRRRRRGLRRRAPERARRGRAQQARELTPLPPARQAAILRSAMRTRSRRMPVVVLRRSSRSSTSRMKTIRMSGRTLAKEPCSAT